MMMLYIGSAYAQPALAPVCSVTTPAPSRAAAASQNQSDTHLYLVLVATETSVAMAVLAQTVTTPPASKQTAALNLMLVVSSLRMTSHNLS